MTNCSAPAPPAKPGLTYPSVMCRRRNSSTWVALSVSKVTSASAVVEPGAAELGVEGDEEPPLEVLVAGPHADGLQALLGGLLGLLEHVEPLVGGGDRHDPAVVAEQARLLQHVLAVEAELDVDVEREGVELAVDDGALPQLGVEVRFPHAVLGEQADVPGVQEPARREAGDPAQVHDAEVGCAVARRRHGQLGVEGAPPLEGGVLHVDAGVGLTEGVQHRDHVVSVAAAEEVPVADAGVRTGGERVRSGAEARRIRGFPRPSARSVPPGNACDSGQVVPYPASSVRNFDECS